MKDDDDRPRTGEILIFPPQLRSEAFDRLAGLERRFDSFEALLIEAVKDIKTTVGIDRASRADTDDRASQLERDIIEHRQRLGELEQAAQRRAKKVRSK